MTRGQRLHPLAQNHKTWTPHLVGVFDTEFTTGPPEPGAARGTFRCVCAASARRHGKARKGQVSTLQSDRAGDLVEWIEDVAEPGVALWLYAHNAAVDVQASGLLDDMLRRGWRISRHGLGNPSLWALLVRDRQSVHLCDSLSLFGCSVLTLGDMLETPKLAMPGPDADLQAWLDYCTHDVEIVMHALLQTMADWERLGLGRWTDTGPGCGWNSLRHRVSDAAVWIDPDPAGRAFERAAIYGGRRELLCWGQWPEAEYVDLDLAHAHLSIAANLSLPCSRGRAFESLPLESPLIGGAGAGCIACCVVRAATPRYPLRTAAGVVYPVGEFDTILCGPELADARRRGELVSVGPGYTYRLSHWPAAWARWVADVLDGQVDGVGPTLRQLLKGCSKTVWGRTAMRVTGTVKAGDGPSDELRLERGWDRSRDCGLIIVDWGWQRTIELQDQEGDDSFPAILAWIQAHVRVLMAQLVDALGEEAVAVVATDGVLVAPWRLAELAASPAAGAGQLDQLSEVAGAAVRVLGEEVWPCTLRVKDVLRRVRALGPETIESEHSRVISGVPRSARPVGAWLYQGEVWPTFVTMTQAPWSGSVLVEPRTWDCSGARPLRWVAEDGCCEPLTAARWWLGGGSTMLGPPAGCRRHESPLRADQHAALVQLAAGGELGVVKGPGPGP